MAISASDVKKLREMTNVGMMDCKKALMACDGDMDAAIDYLREKGLAKAAKKADRVAAEGMAYADVFNGVGVVIEVNCETDFAAGTDVFKNTVKALAEAVAVNDPADVDALKACKYPGTDLTVTEVMQDRVMSIGENLQIRRFARFPENTSVCYVHAGGSHGVLVNLAVEGNIDVTEVGKNICMQLSPIMIYIEIQGEKSEAEYSSLEDAALRTKEKPILYNDFIKIKPVITRKDGTQIETKQDNATWAEQTEICYYRPKELFALEDVAEVQLEGFTFVPAEP